jgi:hypothetical protein
MFFLLTRLLLAGRPEVFSFVLRAAPVFAATSQSKDEVMPGIYVAGLDTTYPLGHIRKTVKALIAAELNIPAGNVNVYFLSDLEPDDSQFVTINVSAAMFPKPDEAEQRSFEQMKPIGEKLAGTIRSLCRGRRIALWVGIPDNRSESPLVVLT